MNGGYLMISLSDPNLFERLLIGINLGKPILIKDGKQNYFIDNISGGEITEYEEDEITPKTYNDIVYVAGNLEVKIKQNNTYTKGEVINPDAVVYKLKDITDITALTDDEINSLECGDLVLKKTGNQYHTYVVSYKEANQGICLTYTDASVVETISYDYSGEHWVYNSTDVTEIQNKLVIGENVTINTETLTFTYDDDTTGTLSVVTGITFNE